MIEIIAQEPGILEKIKVISSHYSKKQQWEQTQEELNELMSELQSASNPFGYEDLVYLPDNTWSEIADVLIMCIQLIIQHGAADRVQEQVEYKVNRQLSRMRHEGVSAADTKYLEIETGTDAYET